VFAEAVDAHVYILRSKNCLLLGLLALTDISVFDFRSLPAVSSSKNASGNKRKRKTGFAPKKRRSESELKSWNAKRLRKLV
jgi:hypothetical protein